MTDPRAPLVSVLVPSFNAGPYLAESVGSALRTDVPIEIIIQDAGSIDGSLDGLPIDERLQIVVESDSGQADALNRALSRARGRYVGWLNADDLYYEGWADAVLASVDSRGDFDLAFGNFDVIDSNGLRLRRYRVSPWSWRRLYRRGCYVWSGATFFRRELLDDLKFNADLNFCMDLDLFLRVPADAEIRQLDERVAAFRWHRDAKTSSEPFSFVAESMRIRAQYLRQDPSLLGQFLFASILSFASTLLTPLRQSAAWARVRQGKRL